MILRNILILFLIFSFQTWTKADDISEFEIEGISIRDNLLNHFSLEEIEKKLNDENTFYYKDKKFVDIFFQLTKKKYEWLQITIKPNDKKFTIYAVGGQIDYVGNIEQCYKDMDKIYMGIKNEFNAINFKNPTHIKHEFDKTGNSTVYFSRLKFLEGNINIECYDWSEKLPYTDKLLISVMDLKFRNFIDNEAYD